ncbi:pentatricopeptide repeat-containing protein, partial [Tanacetum coccineum]
QKAHTRAVKHGFKFEYEPESDIFVGISLIDMYVKCGSVEDKKQVFENMVHKDCVSWNAIIVGFAQNVCMVVSSPYGKSVPSHQCPDVMNKIKPCDALLRSWGNSGHFPKTCCTAFRDLIKSTTFNHQTTCYCLTQAVRNKDINPIHSRHLPMACIVEVETPFPISPDTDCTKVK